jgi:hypothetical protein
MICPECLGTVETSDGKTAQCKTHGGEFQVLFSHWRPADVPPLIPAGMAFALAPGAMCAQHTKVSAVNVCADCGIAMCETCTFDGADGSRLCANCKIRRGSVIALEAPPAIPEDARCVQHRSVAATLQCKLCGSYMCATCDFELPGNLHVCPPCATSPRTALSPRRKVMMWGSFGFAILATVGMGVLMSGALAGMAEDKVGEQVLGILFSLFVLVPSVVGMGMGLSAIDRRLSNPISLWVATIWNIVLVCAFVLLCIVGIFMK